jgi:AcrR family transcriptional regulator
MDQAPTSRRERLRAETANEIRAVALQQMAQRGAGDISLRAIARQMGTTAPAIYSYYKTRDALIAALVADVYTSLAVGQEAARDALPVGDHAGRLLAVGHAYRRWALHNPQGFRLIYGEPIPGYTLPATEAAASAAKRTCAVLLDLVAAAWSHPSDDWLAHPQQWSDFDPGLVSLTRDNYPQLPPAAITLTLRVWGRMHGPVSLEIYGLLQTGNPAALYEAELLALARELGFAKNAY